MKRYIIILSGWAVDSFVWMPILYLLRKDFEVVIVNWNDVNSIDEFRQKVSDLINENKIDSFSVIGWSLGVLVAIDIALMHSCRIENLILISGTSRFVQHKPSNYNIGWNKEVVEKMLYMLKENTEETLNMFYKNLFSATEMENGNYDVFMREIKKLNKTNCVKSLCIGLEYLLAKDFRENLTGIDIPALLIHGDNDFICPAHAGEYIKKHLRKSQIIKFEKTGHVPFFTRTMECYEIINRFISA